VSKPPLKNPNARYWDDLVEDFGFTQRSKRRFGRARIA